MFVFDDGFRVGFLIEIGFGAFHDDVGIVSHLHGVADENLFVGCANFPVLWRVWADRGLSLFVSGRASGKHPGSQNAGQES